MYLDHYTKRRSWRIVEVVWEVTSPYQDANMFRGNPFYTRGVLVIHFLRKKYKSKKKRKEQKRKCWITDQL